MACMIFMVLGDPLSTICCGFGFDTLSISSHIVPLSHTVEI